MPVFHIRIEHIFVHEVDITLKTVEQAKSYASVLVRAVPLEQFTYESSTVSVKKQEKEKED